MVCRVDISSCVPEERGASFATTTVVARPRGQGGLAGAQRGIARAAGWRPGAPESAPKCAGISAQVSGTRAQAPPEWLPKCGRNRYPSAAGIRSSWLLGAPFTAARFALFRRVRHALDVRASVLQRRIIGTQSTVRFKALLTAGASWCGTAPAFAASVLEQRGECRALAVLFARRFTGTLRAAFCTRVSSEILALAVLAAAVRYTDPVDASMECGALGCDIALAYAVTRDAGCRTGTTCVLRTLCALPVVANRSRWGTGDFGHARWAVRIRSTNECTFSGRAGGFAHVRGIQTTFVVGKALEPHAMRPARACIRRQRPAVRELLFRVGIAGIARWTPGHHSSSNARGIQHETRATTEPSEHHFG